MKKSKLKVLIVLISLILIISIVINLRNIIKKTNIENSKEALDYKTDTNVTYSIEVEKETKDYVIACLIFEDKLDGIEEIESPNGSKISTTGKTKIAIDYKLERDTNKLFKIRAKDGEVTDININISDYVYSGDGTEENPYIIKTPVLLQRVIKELNAHYKLGANIDLSGRDWTVIGTEENPFSGSIDGDGYTISNLTVESSEDNVGLFGKATGVIKNIKIENFNIKGNNNVGGLVGQTTGEISNSEITGSVVEGTGENVGGIVGYTTGEISNSEITGSVVEGTGDNVGGLVGYTISNVTNSTAEVEVTGVNQVGGAIGYSYGGARTITRTIATGTVTGTEDNVGGLIGRADLTNTVMNITESYATGDVKAEGNNVGGLIGYVNPFGSNYWTTPTMKIENVYEIGRVEGRENVGGLIGYIYREDRNTLSGNIPIVYTQITNTYAVGEVSVTGEEGHAGGLIGRAGGDARGSNTVTNSYWTPETTKQTTSVLGIAKTIQEMLTASGYVDWDFETIWTIEENQTYAYLRNLPKPTSQN